MDHLAGLNAEQKKAVLHTEGPLLILAGAGAGKTRVITHRILHLMREGVTPHEIIAVTFTNKAAREMRERIGALMEQDGPLNFPLSQSQRPFVSTFHALGVHILKAESARLGLSRHFKIYDRSDSERAIKEAIREAGLDPKAHEPRKFLGAISKQKGAGVSVESYEGARHAEYFAELLYDVWSRYEKRLSDDRALDFDDLLLQTVLLLEREREVREKYQNTWRYLHVDEYQDTNKVQYALTKLLSGKHRNVCVVGDADQNIYSWRGANLDNILNFEKDFEGGARILLEENYRSTQTILNVSNAIIQKNRRRLPKNLFTHNPAGELVGLCGTHNEGAEAGFVVAEAARLIQEGVAPKNIAVLYRANFQSRVLEEAFLLAGIPYQVLGTRFFDRKEVRDALAYLSLALNPDNRADQKRIINVPPRGIGKITLLKILSGKVEGLSAKTKLAVEKFHRTLNDIRAYAKEKPPSETVRFAIRASGLEEMYAGGTEEDEERLGNLRELATVAAKYDGFEPEEGIEKFLEESALASDQDELKEERDAVRLMTVHASKGLEFDYVFITGLEEGLFPHTRMGQDREKDDEEERRLFYVALTRARKKVFLSYASVRMLFGSPQMNVPSQFITDIDAEFLEALGESADTPAKVIYLD